MRLHSRRVLGTATRAAGDAQDDRTRRYGSFRARNWFGRVARGKRITMSYREITCPSGSGNRSKISPFGALLATDGRIPRGFQRMCQSPPRRFESRRSHRADDRRTQRRRRNAVRRWGGIATTHPGECHARAPRSPRGVVVVREVPPETRSGRILAVAGGRAGSLVMGALPSRHPCVRRLCVNVDTPTSRTCTRSVAIHTRLRRRRQKNVS